ncbi:hypothetical protein KY084_02075 [Stakelama sp. CBK3Z-3]|uniref:Uncharacterized protein n=1 Tax=Stakelama flava TaxID=2860338 RepID=A0ABS6XHP3_9SPHN|nr:hypothetical protein [Stakelama flava]MBW4329661.1 hypothetical protein [Stakelama flava]
MKSGITGVVGIFVAVVAIGALAIFDHASGAEASIQDQAAVYNAVLASWQGKEQGHQLVDEHLSEAPSKADAEFEECAKGLDFPAGSDARKNKSLIGIPLQAKGIEIIDGSKWAPADLGAAIANGEAVETAVKEGFSHSLISLSQITFSNDGRDALVKFGMACGSLCGSGSTIHLHKRSTGWSIVDRCGAWMS